MQSDDALATILLVSRIACDETSPLTPRQFWNLVDQIGKPGRLLGMSEEDLVGLGLGTDMASRMAGLLARATAMAFELERLDQSGIATLTPFDPAYPQRFRTNLGPKAPPILHAAGAPALLNEGGVGVVGSRNVSKEGAKVAVALGRQAASLNVPLISGAARGVDQLAMNAALKAGGAVISLLAHSPLSYPEVSKHPPSRPHRPDSHLFALRSGFPVLSRPSDGPQQAHLRPLRPDRGSRRRPRLRRHLVRRDRGDRGSVLPSGRLARPRRGSRKRGPQ